MEHGQDEPDNPFDAPPGSSKKKARKKPTSGKVAMEHARSICRRLYPHQLPPIEASKKISWIPIGDPCRHCRSSGRMPRTVSEDLFGCFDLLVVGFGVMGALIQVTTETRADKGGGQTVTARMRKIEKWMGENPITLERFHLAPSLEIWSWVRRKHMRRWKWSYAQDPLLAGEWAELRPCVDPSEKKQQKAQAAQSGSRWSGA